MPHLTQKPGKFKADAKLVIFDWSGVISDDRRPVYEADGVVLRKYGMEPASFATWLIESQASALEYFRANGIDQEDHILLKEYDEGLTEVREQGVHPVLYPDALTTLATLRENGKRIFVVSKHPTSHLLRESKEYGIDQYIEHVLGSVHDKSMTIRDIVARCQVQSFQTLYVGDMIFDIQAAKKAHVISVGITTGYHTRERLLAERPDIIIDSLSELIQ